MPEPKFPVPSLPKAASGQEPKEVE
jgi:hypothetical protein